MENTAKNFVLQLGSLIALYISLAAMISVLFGLINILIPDAAEASYAYDSAQNQIRFGIASLVVFFPAYVILLRIVNQARRKERGEYLRFTRWLIYLSLLIGGAILLGDLVAVILTYLNGEITTRFILKALSLLFIIGLAFDYYFLDARGYWTEHEEHSRYFGYAVTAIVLVVAASGVRYADSPSEVRERRIDQAQIADLQDMQWRIEEYYRVTGALPDTISDVYSGIKPPEAPESRDEYSYDVLSDTSFELCAEFAESSDYGEQSFARPIIEEIGIKNPHNWDHDAGDWCFERFLTTIRPE